MRKRSRERLHGSLAPVLTPPTLSAIHDLNSDYIELLIANRDVPQLSASLPPTVLAGLAELNKAARRALAACPFALYSLGIEHQDFWRACGGFMVAEETPRYQSSMSLSAVTSFGISALFFAWHVASAQRMAAKVFFAMPDAALDALARLRLWELQRMAAERSMLMKPRWPTNNGFWPDLVRFAARGDIERLNTTQLLGSQLIAADLRAHAASRSARSSVSTGALLPIP